MGLKKRIERTMFYKAKPEIFANAKELRQNMTEAEKILWDHLRKKLINGFRFKAQHPVGRFIADFYCHKAKLAIEIDGEYHLSEEQKEKDLGRQAEFENYGIQTLRFTNSQIMDGIENVLNQIRLTLPPAPPNPLKGENNAQ